MIAATVQQRLVDGEMCHRLGKLTPTKLRMRLAHIVVSTLRVAYK